MERASNKQLSSVLSYFRNFNKKSKYIDEVFILNSYYALQGPISPATSKDVCLVKTDSYTEVPNDFWVDFFLITHFLIAHSLEEFQWTKKWVNEAFRVKKCSIWNRRNAFASELKIFMFFGFLPTWHELKEWLLVDSVVIVAQLGHVILLVHVAEEKCHRLIWAI